MGPLGALLALPLGLLGRSCRSLGASWVSLAGWLALVGASLGCLLGLLGAPLQVDGLPLVESWELILPMTFLGPPGSPGSAPSLASLELQQTSFRDMIKRPRLLHEHPHLRFSQKNSGFAKENGFTIGMKWDRGWVGVLF